MKQKEKTERWYWIWVSGPESYLDGEGNELSIDSKSNSSSLDGEWTCHPDTKKGDLILLYRSRLKKDIGYLIQAKSDAYQNPNKRQVKNNNWTYCCDCKFIYKFDITLPLAEMKASHYLSKNFSALRGNFQKMAYYVSPDNWQRLNKILARKNPSYEKVLAKMEQSPMAGEIWLEEHLEERLAADLKPLRKHGYHLKLVERQLVCLGNSARIDLLCYDTRKNCYVVIELKNVRAGRDTIAQIANYIMWVKNFYAKRKRVEGLVISGGSDIAFRNTQEFGKYKIHQLDIETLDLK
ncbi:MAG TPA: endonuclease NucS domain-containing protein [Pyrinomonadaceae bacterium]|jgi:hypothetical protein|nr:endonuclease NucS domain-containing protein [Pyrinomonadaceae bacterium]